MFRVMVPVENNGTTYWYKIGVAFQGPKGITINLATMPITPTGKIFLFPEMEEDGKPAKSRAPTEGDNIPSSAFEDDIPF